MDLGELGTARRDDAMEDLKPLRRMYLAAMDTFSTR